MRSLRVDPVPGGVQAGYAALAIRLFNSIMFPTICTITLARSNAGAEATPDFFAWQL